MLKLVLAVVPPIAAGVAAAAIVTLANVMVELDANAVEGVPKDKGAPLVADPKNLHLDMVKNEDIAGNESDPNRKMQHRNRNGTTCSVEGK